MANSKKRVRYSKEGETSRAAWLRQQILQRPDITLEQIQVAYDKTAYPKEGRPTDMNLLYGARSKVMSRYGWKSLAEIPRKPNGKLNMAGIVRVVFNQNPKATNEEVREFLAQDGLEASDATIHYVRYNPAPASKDESPDEHQETGPRAGADTRKQRPQKKRRRTKQERLAELKDDARTFEQMEKELEPPNTWGRAAWSVNSGMHAGLLVQRFLSAWDRGEQVSGGTTGRF